VSTDFHEQSAAARVDLRLEGAIAEYLAHYGVAESDIWSVQVIALGAVGDVLDEARANERAAWNAWAEACDDKGTS